MKAQSRKIFYPLTVALLCCMSIAGSLEQASAQSRPKSCAIQGLNQAGLKREDIYRTSNSQELDAAIYRELNLLATGFLVRPGFYLLNDEGGPNAYATEQKLDTRNPSDGTVLFGVNLMREEFQSSSGPGYAIPGIMAHEFAHILQFKKGSNLPVKLMELHADYLAGWYMANRQSFILTDAREAFTSFFNKGDYDFNNPNHHGTPRERLQAIQEGFRARSLHISQAYERGQRYVEDNFAARTSDGTNPRARASGSSTAASNTSNNYREAIIAIARASDTDFRDVLGQVLRTDNYYTYYRTQIMFPGALSCEIFKENKSRGDIGYKCLMFKSDNQNEVESRFASLVEALKNTPLDGWSAQTSEIRSYYARESEDGHKISADILYYGSIEPNVPGRYRLFINFRLE